jgi:RsiW-degrading membrane proteinase PrsW (M82 family)
MAELVCCICGDPVGEQPQRIGGRVYCDRHHAHVTASRRGVWSSGVIQVAALVVFVLIVEVILSSTPLVLDQNGLVLAGVVLAVIPALLWLTFFYAQDRLEPEPKGYVGGVFLLGGLLASAIGIPLLRDVFRTSDWLGASTVTTILGSILVIGVVQEFLKYAAVRYSIYQSREFDERVDGIIYGTAAGLGYATMLNIQFVIDSQGADLRAALIHIVVTALAQASFAGITGYFLARAKFEEEPVWWLPSGVALAAILNGVFTFVRGEITTTRLSLSGGGFNPWPGLILATAVALAVLLLLSRLIQRANKITLSGADAAQATQA